MGLHIGDNVVDNQEWLGIDGWSCIPGCPDDVCRSLGTCAYNDPDSIVEAGDTFK